METYAKTWKLELHHFTSVTATDAEILTGTSARRPAVLTAALRLPTPGLSTMPAVVLMHGSGGVSGYVDDWARSLNCLGVATFLVDSFTGRGLDTTFADQSALGRLAMMVDAYRAFDVLAQHPRIDASRIALMGFSRGGQAALYSAVERFERMHGPVSGHFVAHVAFYPACHIRYLDDEKVVPRPIHVLHGTADDFNPIEPCRDYVARVRAAGGRIQLHEFPDAHHVFDWPMVSRPLILQGMRSNCGALLEERARGEIVLSGSNLTAEQVDRLFTMNPTLAYDAASYQRARDIVRNIVTETLLR